MKELVEVVCLIREDERDLCSRDFCATRIGLNQHCGEEHPGRGNSLCQGSTEEISLSRQW